MPNSWGYVNGSKEIDKPERTGHNKNTIFYSKFKHIIEDEEGEE